ncbi:MAG: sugar phosphate nucleotidyltransferase [Patescibacteria group bacterium]
MKKVTKLVLPVAGFGKRLMPLTKKTPKNLLKVNGKPLVEYAIEEAVQSGIKDVILIVNPKIKSAFDAYVKRAKKKFQSLDFHIRVQETPAGNGHALISAADLIKGEPFAVRFCDDVLVSNSLILGSLLKVFEKYKSSAMLLERIPKSQVHSFGVVAVKKRGAVKGVKGKIYQVTGVVEKPSVKLAPSNLIVVGGYVLTPTVLRNLIKVAESLPNAAADAIPINVGLQIELITGKKIYGWEFVGKRFDCGTLEKFQKAQVLIKKFMKYYL